MGRELGKEGMSPGKGKAELRAIGSWEASSGAVILGALTSGAVMQVPPEVMPSPASPVLIGAAGSRIPANRRMRFPKALKCFWVPGVVAPGCQSIPVPPGLVRPRSAIGAFTWDSPGDPGGCCDFGQPGWDKGLGGGGAL